MIIPLLLILFFWLHLQPFVYVRSASVDIANEYVKYEAKFLLSRE
jgi:hypothetical protein